MAKQTKGGLQRFAEGNRVKKGKGMAALNVLGRIGSDADTAMATRRMGNTQFGDVGPSTQGIIKDVGGNWVPSAPYPYMSELERQLKRMQRGVNDMPTDQLVQLIDLAKSRGNETLAASLERDLQSAIKRDAGNKFIQSNLKNYITKEMATEKDPVRKLAEQGITAFPKTEDEYGDIMLRNYGSHTSKVRREETGFPEEGVAKSKLAKHYETLADEAINPREAKRYQQIQKLPYMQRPRGVADMPFVEKLDPESFMYQLSDEADFEKLGFNHIMDVLREDMATGRIRPEQLNKMSMEQAVRRTHQYDEDLARKMLEARQKEMGEANIFKEYPDDGYKWVQLDRPGQFALESDTMGHSVRGYEPPKGHPDWIEGSGDSGSDSYGHGGWEAIKSGRAKIYSLRDPKGLSHTTVEVGPQNFFDFNKWWEKQPKELKDEINARARRGEHGGSIYEAPEYLAEREAMPPMVSQIKGKQNAAPNEQYLPYIQDFVKSGDFSEVRELHNAGLMNAEKMLDPTTYAKYVENKLEVPRYATEAELEKLHNEYLKLAEPRNAKPEFAKGGNVSHSHHYYQIARDFDLPHLSEGGEVMEGDAHERHRVIQDLYATIADMKAKNSPKKFDKGGYAFQDPMGAPDSALTMDQQEGAQAFKDAARNAYYNDKRHMVTPKGRKEFAQQALASYAGQPVDIANMLAGGLDATVGQAMGKAFPSLMKPVSVLDPKGEKVLAYPLSSDKPRGGSADQIERLGHDYEFYSAPLAAVAGDIGLGLAAPAGRMLERGANKGYSAARRPFTPATMTVEATAPDLGQRTSMGYRQGLNDRLISSERGGTDLSNIGGRPTTRREGQGAWMGSQGFETNPLAAIDVPRAGDLSKNAEFRRAMAQAGTNLNQEGMAAHRFLPNLTSNPRDASAMLIKPKKGALSNEQVVGLAKELGNRMVVAHNPRLGGVVVHPFGEAAEGDKFVKQARAKARKVLGNDASIKYGRADINKDRAFMMGEDYAGAGAMPADESVRQVREMLKRQSREAFPNGDAPTGGVQPWSIGENYPTHVQGIGNGERVDYRPVNYATGEIGQTVPTYAEAESGRVRMLNDHHRSLPKRVR